MDAAGVPIQLFIEEDDTWVGFERYYALCHAIWHKAEDVSTLLTHKRYVAENGCIFSILVMETDVQYAYNVVFSYSHVVDGIAVSEQHWTFVMPVDWYGHSGGKAAEIRDIVEKRVLDEEWFIREFFEFMDDYEERS